jgi:hypothetical protein
MKGPPFKGEHMAEPREPELEPDEKERSQVLLQLEEWLERPMLVLSFLWLSLVLVETDLDHHRSVRGPGHDDLDRLRAGVFCFG